MIFQRSIFVWPLTMTPIAFLLLGKTKIPSDSFSESFSIHLSPSLSPLILFHSVIAMSCSLQVNLKCEVIRFHFCEGIRKRDRCIFAIPVVTSALSSILEGCPGHCLPAPCSLRLTDFQPWFSSPNPYPELQTGNIQGQPNHHSQSIPHRRHTLSGSPQARVSQPTAPVNSIPWASQPSQTPRNLHHPFLPPGTNLVNSTSTTAPLGPKPHCR